MWKWKFRKAMGLAQVHWGGRTRTPPAVEYDIVHETQYITWTEVMQTHNYQTSAVQNRKLFWTVFYRLYFILILVWRTISISFYQKPFIKNNWISSHPQLIYNNCKSIILFRWNAAFFYFVIKFIGVILLNKIIQVSNV